MKEIFVIGSEINKMMFTLELFSKLSHHQVQEAIKMYKLKDAFDKLALKLNNFVHSNGQLYYNFSYQRMDTHSNISKYCKEFGETITYITMSFLMVLVLIRPINYVRRLH